MGAYISLLVSVYENILWCNVKKFDDWLKVHTYIAHNKEENQTVATGCWAAEVFYYFLYENLSFVKLQQLLFKFPN